MTIKYNEFTREIVTLDGKRYIVYGWDDPQGSVERLRVFCHINGRRVKEHDQSRLLCLYDSLKYELLDSDPAKEAKV